MSRLADYDVYYTCPSGDSWLLPVRLSYTQGNNAQPALTISSDGDLHVCWRLFGTDSARIFYTRRDTAWTMPRPIAACPDWAGWPCLAAGLDGAVHLGFDGDDGSGLTDVYYMRLWNGEWSAPVNLSNTWGELSWSSAVATDRSGTVYFCWCERDSFFHAELRYRWRTTDWSVPTVLAEDPVRNSWEPRFVERAGSQGPDLLWVSNDPSSEPSAPWLVYHMKLSSVSGVAEPPAARLGGRPVLPATLSRGTVTLRSLRAGEGCRLKLLDMCGRVVSAEDRAVVAPDGSIRWDVRSHGGNTAGGIYAVAVSQSQGVTFFRVVIVP
jgi:hypothetical protein